MVFIGASNLSHHIDEGGPDPSVMVHQLPFWVLTSHIITIKKPTIIKKETVQTGPKDIAIPIKNSVPIIPNVRYVSNRSFSFIHEGISFIHNHNDFPLATKTIMITPRIKRIISPVFIISQPSYIKKTLHHFPIRTPRNLLYLF